MTTTHIEVTLKEMLQMALGAPKIGKLNITILHCLFDILLKKLDCQHERVELEGQEAACLQSILRKSNIALLPFNSDKVELLSHKMEELTHLRTHQENVENQLNEHLEEIRACNNKDNSMYSTNDWFKYCGPCEWYCTNAETETDIYCNLLENYDFITKVKRLVEEPVIGPIMNMRKRIEELHVQLLDYQRLLAEKCKRLSYIDTIALDIDKFSHLIVLEKNSFQTAMEELQSMMDGKMYKLVLPTLKKYIQTEMEKINEVCNMLKKKERCGSNMKFSGTTTTCLSCTGKLTCTSRPILIAPQRSAEITDVKKRKIANACSRTGPCLEKQKEKELLERLKIINERTEEAKINREISKSCYKQSDHFEVFQGTNGVYYRKA
uniref:UvrABC system protein A n=1 Tax=Zeugodacus cucurbitae TaxID=28588 RepID=A0A0A1XID4_ZEUCU